jgi:hypothetical protein
MYVLVHNRTWSSRSDDRSLIDTGGGYHLQNSEYENIPLSPFLSGILHFPLVAPPSLKLSHKLIANINYIEPPS